MTETGTAYLLLPSPRSALFPSLVKYLGLKVSTDDNTGAHYKEAFPLHKCPAFESSDGWKLHETMAILEYLVSLAPKDATYLFWGKDVRQKAKVWQWISFANTDCVGTMVNYLHSTSDAEKAANAAKIDDVFEEFEAQLKKTPFLAGEEETLADAFAVFLYPWLIDDIFTKAWFEKFPAIAKWFRTVADKNEIVSPELKGLAPKN